MELFRKRRGASPAEHEERQSDQRVLKVLSHKRGHYPYDDRLLDTAYESVRRNVDRRKARRGRSRSM